MDLDPFKSLRIVRYPAWLKSCLAGFVLIFVGINLIFPPPLDAIRHNSPVVTDRDGHWMAGFTVDDGVWRIPVNLEEIDPRFVTYLTTVEDSRFYRHNGVDFPAILRAAKSWRREGRPVSGASTITMQLVRQYEPRPRILKSKILETFRAVQLELFLSKDEILESYLTRISYGGNLEGVYAASLAYFGKPPHYLTDSEIALLIALPQAPEARRPDIHPEMAAKGRDYILEKLVEHGAIDLKHAAEAREVEITSKRHDIPQLAWITAYGLVQPDKTVKTSIDRALQVEVETLAGNFVDSLEYEVNTAVVIVDNRTMEVRAHIASADRDRPGGWIDMTRRARSPGSTLKPFIYAMAIDDGIIQTGSSIQDLPSRFGSYQPENFNRRYYGDVRIYEALQHSLNVPAVMVLDKVGGDRFMTTLEGAGAEISYNGSAQDGPGLALALGGAGLSVNDLAILYAALANDGQARPLVWTMDDSISEKDMSFQLISEATAEGITKVLRQAPTPKGRVPSWLARHAPPIAYKTGTSYGFRDAWAAGYTDEWTVIVWVGRPDGAPRAGQTGRLAAAPLLFDLFAQLPNEERQLEFQKEEVAPDGLIKVASLTKDGPQILFPPDGAELLAENLGSEGRGFSLTARAESEDITFFVDGMPVKSEDNNTIWRPEKPGFYRIGAVDGYGQMTVSNVRVITDLDLSR